MMKEFLGSLHWSALPILSMFLFMGVFFGALIWVYRKNSTQIYSQISNLPLEEERFLKNGSTK